ncbi:glycosyltransferase family 2 protein [Marinihelvus fidelis]|uniref:Glycosyltransferase family 2 protein n=1 Tax=Marinihelvus fidelis TaxID=2613842 RepID=A0A5N0TFU8_9GAMM|nr:glycosyltransferase family 2 protein [Marinihelvus fidelis]KAA9133368.1 glycosyltransferase family 2 protein [Marinihelvus fidelis]
MTAVRNLRCLVVIPAHNEQGDIAQVVREVREDHGLDVVVVDDASTDATVKKARQAGALVLPLSIQLGAWGAIQAGMRYALRAGYHNVLTMDADGQHEAVWIPNLLGPVESGTSDVTIGCCVRRGSWMRKIAWKILKAVSGLTREDITSGFRAYNRDAFRLLASRQATLLEYQDVGVLVLLRNAGLDTHDVEVTMLPRRSGTSRVYHSWFAVIYYMCHTILLGFSKRRVRR